MSTVSTYQYIFRACVAFDLEATVTSHDDSNRNNVFEIVIFNG
jgi:hypothetical protein